MRNRRCHEKSERWNAIWTIEPPTFVNLHRTFFLKHIYNSFPLLMNVNHFREFIWWIETKLSYERNMLCWFIVFKNRILNRISNPFIGFIQKRDKNKKEKSIMFVDNCCILNVLQCDSMTFDRFICAKVCSGFIEINRNSTLSTSKCFNANVKFYVHEMKA